MFSSMIFMGRAKGLWKRKFPFQILNPSDFIVVCLFCHEIAVSILLHMLNVITIYMYPVVKLIRPHVTFFVKEILKL